MSVAGDYIPEELLLAALNGKLSNDDYLAQSVKGLKDFSSDSCNNDELDESSYVLDNIRDSENNGNSQVEKIPSRAKRKKGKRKDAAFPFFELHRLIEPGYLELEHGYTYFYVHQTTMNTYLGAKEPVEQGGMYFISILTDMGQITGDMFKWWINQCDSTEKYKWSHPYQHISYTWDPQF